jgi:hypothetical protein
LKFAIQAKWPLGATWTVAGNSPSSTLPVCSPVAVENFHSAPLGVPCAVET